MIYFSFLNRAILSLDFSHSFFYYRYLCEFIYYTSLKLAEEADGERRVLFIHIPVLDEKNTVKRITETVQQVLSSCLKQIVWTIRYIEGNAFGSLGSPPLFVTVAKSFEAKKFLKTFSFLFFSFHLSTISAPLIVYSLIKDTFANYGNLTFFRKKK